MRGMDVRDRTAERIGRSWLSPCVGSGTLVLVTAIVALVLLGAGCGGTAASTTTLFTGTTGTPVATTASTSPSTTLSPTQVKAAAETLVDDMARGDFAAVTQHFDDVMKRALSEPALAGSWQSVVQQLGSYEKRLDSRMETSGALQVVYVTTQFALGKTVVKVVYGPAGKVSGLWFVPESASAAYVTPAYVDVTSFTETEVTVGSGQWALPGTLTIPRGAGPFPGVVLVHGSGPNDRDETIGPNKPFRDLAQGLASKGIAVLRYEKRTKFYAEEVIGLVDTLTVKEEVVDDAAAALTVLMARPEVDPSHVFLLGHSLGGTLAPRIGQAKPDVAGLIVLAGATRPLEDLILEQTKYLAALSGEISAADQATIKTLEAQVARVKDPALSTSVASSDLPLGISAAYWLDLRAYKPVETARALAKPMLILQGGRDYQVTQADFEGWKTGLAGLTGVEYVLYPDLNHLFMTGTGKATPAEYNTPANVASQVLDSISGWVHRLSGLPTG